MDNIPGESGTLSPGLSISNGQIRIVSNNGVDSAVSIDLSAFTLRTATGDLLTPNLAFNKIQDAKGQSAVADFIAYDSLGIPMNGRVIEELF